MHGPTGCFLSTSLPRYARIGVMHTYLPRSVGVLLQDASTTQVFLCTNQLEVSLTWRVVSLYLYIFLCSCACLLMYVYIHANTLRSLLPLCTCVCMCVFVRICPLTSVVGVEERTCVHVYLSVLTLLLSLYVGTHTAMSICMQIREGRSRAL